MWSSLELAFAGEVSDTALVDALVACRRQVAAVEAKQQEFLAEIARRLAAHAGGRPHHWAVDADRQNRRSEPEPEPPPAVTEDDEPPPF